MRETVPNNGELVCRAVSFVREQAGLREIMIVGSSRGAVDDVGRLACERALAGVYRYTFRDLVYALSERGMYARDWAPLHRVAAETLAASLIREAKLDYLRDAAAFPGFSRALGRTLRNLRLNRVAPERLHEAGRSGPDLAMLMKVWDRELARLSLADYAQRVELAIEEAEGLLKTSSPALLAMVPDVRTAAERHLLKVLEDRAGASLRLTVDRRQSAAMNALSSVQRYAISGDLAPLRAADASGRFFSASSEALEFVEIARRVLGAGVPFDRIAVLLRNPARHIPLAEEAFNRAGIPLWIEGGQQRRDNSGRAFLTLLRCREERFSVARFAEYLSLAPVPGEPLGAGQWERMLNEAAVIAGQERWHSRIEAELERAYVEYEGASSEGLSRRIASLESLRDVALPLIDRLAELPDRALWRDWIAALGELATAALGDTRSVRRALDELEPVADLGPVSRAEVMGTMERLVSDWNDESDGQRYGKVFVGHIDAVCGMSFQLVFIPGLNEGLFPRPRREDPLLLDEQRALLGMPALRDERELLDTALCTASEAAVFSWARLDLATGRERVPSFFAAEVIAAARGADADLDTVIEEAKAEVRSKIGWSAPDDPRESIDNAEYDLSAFREAYKRKGGMGWLRRVNSHTTRAIESRQRRWSKPWSEADGIDADYDMQAAVALKRWKLTEHAYSPTALNQFARCPYRFYLSAIAELKPLPRPDVFDRLDPVTRGRLYHQALFRFLVGGERRSLDEVLGELAEQARERLAPPIRGVWLAEIEKIRADLRAWVNCRDAEWSPQFVELAFGLRESGEHDPASTPDPVKIEDKWPLRGSIDLVERHSSGRLRVIDHKTGKPEKKERNLCCGKGEVLQPVLYALAVEALGHGSPASAALSWATLRGNFRTDEIRIDFDAREGIRRILGAIEWHLERGFLPAAPREDACQGCDYLPVCGPWEEKRVLVKEPGDLKRLREIRRLQ